MLLPVALGAGLARGLDVVNRFGAVCIGIALCGLHSLSSSLLGNLFFLHLPCGLRLRFAALQKQGFEVVVLLLRHLPGYLRCLLVGTGPEVRRIAVFTNHSSPLGQGFSSCVGCLVLGKHIQLVMKPLRVQWVALENTRSKDGTSSGDANTDNFSEGFLVAT